MSYQSKTEKKYQQPRPSGMKPRGFKPKKKSPEENLATQLSKETEDSE